MEELQLHITKHLVVRLKSIQMTQVAQLNTSLACNWFLPFPTYWKPKYLYYSLFSFPIHSDMAVYSESRTWEIIS